MMPPYLCLIGWFFDADCLPDLQRDLLEYA